MRKLSSEQNYRESRQRQKRERKKTIRSLIHAGKLKRYAPGFRNTLVVSAPRRMSLTENYEETVAFFNKIKKLGQVLAADFRRNRRGRVRPFWISLAEVEHLSVRSAVILSAELDRLRRVVGAKLKYMGGESTTEDVTSILSELGCFSLVSVDHPESSGNHTKSRKTLIKMLCGSRLDKDKFSEFDDALGKIFAQYRSLPRLYEGMSEALLNVQHHAYLDGVKLVYPSPGKRWWATACVDNEKRELRIFVYDQGVGIPATLPHTGYREVLTDLLTGAAHGKFGDDATLLKRALEYSRSRTEQAGRGKGFKNIMSAIDTYQTGSLRIVSGRAEVTYSGQGVIVSQRHDQHVGGTLIEWTLPTRLFESSKEPGT
jgi:hypothetical protein